MARRRSVDEKLAELEAAVDAAAAGELAGLLDDALGERNYRIVALAAHYAGDRLVYDCIPSLLRAYAGFVDNGVKRDPNCLAKKAAVRALHALDCDDIDFYLEALSYRQLEPVWGGTVDTATDIRSSAAMGLVASGYPRALVAVVDLLTDPEAPVRAGATRAIACGNPREAELLLRAKVLTGDEEPFVVGECFTGLLAVEPEDSVSFVARFLQHEDDALYEAAALALGESRLPAAIDQIVAAFEDVFVPAERRRILVRAAALHRSNEAFDWLLGLAASAAAALATEVVDVLSIYSHNEALRDRLSKVLVEREDEALQARFAQAWGSPSA